MSNAETKNGVIESNNSVLEKSKRIKDPTNNNDKKAVQINCIDKIYEINGKLFDDRQFKDDEKHIKFEITDDNMASYEEASVSALTDQNEASPCAPFLLGLQSVPNGFIINSNVYLSDRSYHTIVSDDGKDYCAVCENVCDIENYKDHINTEEHIANMKSHAPLCKYDLCIIRKVQENYHCGVCNQIFDIKKSNEHFASKYHEDKLLFAVNRVSDIMYDLDVQKENVQSYHFSVNNIRNDFGGFYDVNKPDYESTDDSVSDVEEMPNPFSYASMAKKPQMTPKFIEIEINGKTMNVRYNSWHMVLILKSNKFYCMVCKIDGHNSLKTDHCMTEEHLSKLKKCTIVEKYAGFVIRKVDHRLYHCAHCNNLQFISDIEDHLNDRHIERKNPNITEKNIQSKRNSIKMTSSLNNIKKNDDEIKGNIINKTVFGIENEVKELYIFGAKFNLSNLSYNMIISNYCCACEVSLDDVHKHIIEVSHIENFNRCPFLFIYDCNLIRLIKNGYHCAICNIIVKYELIADHIIDLNHVESLNRIKTVSNTKIIKDTENNSHEQLSEITEMTEICEETNLDDETKIETERNLTELDDSLETDRKEDSVDSLINIDELVFLKRKKVFAKISLMSYNSLVATGDGTLYCVLCSVSTGLHELKQHIECRRHTDNMKKYKYLDRYEKHLFRQILHTYHCSICNVMFTYKETNLHIHWITHKQELDKCYKIVKNVRKMDVRNGTKQIAIDLQKETLYTMYIDPKIKIGIYYEFSKNNQAITKKSKIVINKDRVLKICWDSWNSFSKSKSGLKCLLCQKELKLYEQLNHTRNVSHLLKLEDSFMTEFNPALIRKINENMSNCVTCNVEIANKADIIINHIKGKKHENNCELLLKNSSECNNYADCTDNIFTLE